MKTTAIDVCVASAGRLMDMINREALNLKRVTFFVVDEADRMFDAKWRDEVRILNQYIRPSRQTLMWSSGLLFRADGTKAYTTAWMIHPI